MSRDLARQVALDAAGFNGSFVFEPYHDSDDDTASFDDRLVFVPDGSVLGDEGCYTIAEPIEQHVAEPLARMLNASKTLALAVLVLMRDAEVSA